MSSIPQEAGLDSSLALLREGNRFIFNRCKRFNSDIFETRLMLKKTICIAGEEAAKEFYKDGRFTRKGAIPPTVLLSLQDKGSVATLDDGAHHWRKHMFMSLMTPESIQRLTDIFTEHWQIASEKWRHKKEVSFFEEIEEILCKAVCQWCGIYLSDEEARRHTREISAMIDGAGAIGLRNWRGLLLRNRAERWLKDVIDRARADPLHPTQASALDTIAWHRGPDDRLLDIEVATVELLNVIRPTVAIGRYILFAAIAMHQFPQCREKLQSNDEDYLHGFVQEVRRFYPFFPFVGGLVRKEFTWRDYHFEEGDRVMLDLYGTTHDARIWDKPETFNPQRFHNGNGNAYTLIPQGGGDFDFGHRCAGEWITIAMMKRAVHLLINSLDYDVVPADLSIDLSRMPALPKDPFIIRNVKLRPISATEDLTTHQRPPAPAKTFGLNARH